MRIIPAGGAGGAVARAAAFAVGLWGVTHVVTHALFADVVPSTSGEVAYRSVAGPLTIAALALIFASAFAIVVGTGGRSTGWRERHRGSDERILAATPAVAPVVFMVTEAATHLGSHHGTPPIDLLVVGSLLHAVVVTVARQLWTACVDRTVRLLDRPTFKPLLPADRGAFTEIASSWAPWAPLDSRPSRGPPVYCR
ncbi:hypothetical protein [Pseudonocardia sp. N23]|uniref:hypothetical protein n=1 Tax=Pseudonocardia sp. N23 TaxID=1987376 RepID=UPI001145984D|nr:hypothetical protein [Pseudonocardia sp. N23]